ncbi:MAG: 50S ribosomal protein L21e [Candidatus Aenigmarchaeota archaeon]|nr:50S ribosomal protein L21e [Candidatus Aenigmarchaeota archaeon]
MVKKTHGSRRRTRRKLRAKRILRVSDILQKFRIGDKVHIVINPSSKSFPHPRFHGTTGEIIETRGSAYVVLVKDGKKEKKIIAKPEHLKIVGKE